MIPYGRQEITEEDIKAVINTLSSDFLTQGPVIAAFENDFADYVGSKYAVAVANGTAALHVSALALNINEGDKVITTPLTFAASANCVRYCGGEVVFADIDPKTYLLDLKSVKVLLENAPAGSYKGIIPVDFAGRSVDLEAFRELANKHDLWILEDACHAPGGYFYDGQKKKQYCGNGEFADASIFSFHPVKHIATGEGGMITTNSEELYNRMLRLRNHGISRNSNDFEQTVQIANGTYHAWELDSKAEQPESYPGWYMELQELGYNYRLSDIHAALGQSQLKKAEERLARRRMIAEKYNDAFSNHSKISGQSGVIEGHAYHLYILEVRNRRGLYEHLRANSIFSQIHYIPLHLMPYYKSLGWKLGDLPNVEKYYKNCISIPMYPGLKDSEIEYVIKTILDYYKTTYGD